MARSHEKRNGIPIHLLISLLLIIVLPRVSCGGGHSHVSAGGECVDHHEDGRDPSLARKLKIVAIVSILVSSALGILLPILATRFGVMKADSSIFFPIKAFAAGIILATGMVHMLPVGSVKLGSPCLKENPWQKFPFAPFIAMVAAVLTFIVESAGANFYKRLYEKKASRPEVRVADVEDSHRDDHKKGGEDHGDGGGHVHGTSKLLDGETMRHRVVAQVLELGIVSHSVIIGMNVGTLENPSTIRPLIAALCFHQFFEGMALGGCLLQAKFRMRLVILMATLFSITVPLGVAIGIGITSSYDENSRTALIVEGVLDAISAGILIYAGLVDLLAAEFGNPKLQSNGRLQLLSYVTLLLGLAAMSIIGKWA